METKHYIMLKDGTITDMGTVMGDWSQTLCEHSFCIVGSNSCKCCPAFDSVDEEKQIVQCKYDDFISIFGKSILRKQIIQWRRCKAGYKFPSDAIVIPDDERTTDRDPRLVRCAVWDSKYILIDDLKKLPVDNG